MRDLEPPPEETPAMRGIRAWRSTKRKKLVEDIESLITLANKLALSQYTHHAQRAKWTWGPMLVKKKDESDPAADDTTGFSKSSQPQ